MRSKWKGLVIPVNLYKLTIKKYYLFYKKKNFKYFYVKRSNLILKFLQNLKFYIYNGWKKMLIYILLSKHYKRRFGEFSFTKKRSLYLSKRKLKKLKKKKKKK